VSKKLEDKRIKEIRDSRRCRDCNSFSSTYMLEEKIWLKIWPTYHEDRAKIKDDELRCCVLCFKCAQKRLGRKFKRNDFSDVPVNDIVFYFLK
jgi:hypothetical protein